MPVNMESMSPLGLRSGFEHPPDLDRSLGAFIYKSLPHTSGWLLLITADRPSGWVDDKVGPTE